MRFSASCTALLPNAGVIQLCLCLADRPKLYSFRQLENKPQYLNDIHIRYIYIYMFAHGLAIEDASNMHV